MKIIPNPSSLSLFNLSSPQNRQIPKTVWTSQDGFEQEWAFQLKMGRVSTFHQQQCQGAPGGERLYWCHPCLWESVLKENISGGGLLRCDPGLWRWWTWGTSSHPLCLQFLLPQGETVWKSIFSKRIYIRCSRSLGSDSQWYSCEGWISFSTSYHNHKKQKQKFTKIMSKGGDETADISAGFHIHRRGGVAQVENLSLHL